MSFWSDQQELGELPSNIEVVESPQQPSVEKRVEIAFKGLEVQQQQTEQRAVEEQQTLSEVEVRLRKANLYRLILENPLIEDGDELATEVEDEIREFVVGQLQLLMGLRTEPVKQFTDEEQKALRLWASKLLGKPAIMKIEDRPAPTIKPAAMKSPPAPSLRPVAAPPQQPKRGRGRPPGTGKNQIAARRVEEESHETPAPQPQPTEDKPKIVESVVEVNGKSVKVQHNVTPVARPAGVKPLPMPSEQEALMQGAMQAANLEMQANSNPLIQKAIQAVKQG